MELNLTRRLLPLAALCAVGLALAQEPVPAGPAVSRCVLDGMVDAGSAAYLVDCVQRAEAAKHEALLIRLDTPGGSLESTREIVRTFLSAQVPVLLWVGPSGARAGSAGVFLTLASHLAAMAPGTNIGAAHPVVGMSGEDPEKVAGKEMAKKIVNDTAAFAESIAQQRGRNAAWAAEAVRKSVSVSAEKAVDLKVVDRLAPTEADFLAWAHGRKVKLPEGERKLTTRDARIVELTPSLGQRVLQGLAHPAVAYLLFLLAGLGVAIELSNPGLIVPGLVGIICLVLALLASSALPIRTGAVVLLFMGMALMVAELFVSSGLLGVGGALLFGLGGIFLVDRFDPEWFTDRRIYLPLRFTIPLSAVAAGIAAYVAVRGAQSRRLPQRAGDLGLIGEQGHAVTAIGLDAGEAFVQGEHWRARSSIPIPAGSRVVVRRVDGLTLHVDEVKA